MSAGLDCADVRIHTLQLWEAFKPFGYPASICAGSFSPHSQSFKTIVFYTNKDKLIAEQLMNINMHQTIAHRTAEVLHICVQMQCK